MSRPRPRPSPAAGLALLPALLAACASYPDRLRSAVRDFEAGDNQRALAVFSDRDKVKSRFLQGAEAGTVAFSELDWPGAVAHFERAVAAVRDFEDRAVLGEGALETLGTLTFNETAAEYPGEGFERVLLHSFLALCYLAQGDLQSLRVETRRANQLLEREEELYEKRYQAGGLGHFLSASAYLLEGDLDDALIDYRRMLDKSVGLGVAGPEAARIVRRLGRHEEFPDLLAQHPDFPALPGAGERPAWIVVIAGVGLAPFKEERMLAFPTPAGVISMAVPVYVSRYQPVEGMRLELPQAGAAFELATLEEVEQVARENLDDRLAALAAKTAIRNAARLALRNNLQDNGSGGALAALAVDVYSLVAERADLRSWLTLPLRFQALRLAVPPGEHELVLDAPGAGRIELGRRYLEPGETLFVLGRSVGMRLSAAAVGGQPVFGSSLAPSPDSEALDPLDALDLLNRIDRSLEPAPAPGQP